MKSKSMNIVIWILQGLLSAVFLLAGGMKVITPYEQIIETLPWATAVSPWIIKLIGTLEILGTAGMNLPLLLKKLQFLSPLAALGLAATMIGAVILHFSRSEPFVMQIVFMLALLFIAYIRKLQLQTD